MNDILQETLPPELEGDVRLPGTSPCGADDWLRVDEAYAAQMAYREALLAERPSDVLWVEPGNGAAPDELMTEALALLQQLDFVVEATCVTRPDGRVIALDWDNPLRTLGHLVQEDLCILEKRGDEHVLTGAVLCFPANWRLADKVGRPLTQIHAPVDEYDSDVARRVQRLFDGVKVGRPLTRHNRLRYASSELHQPSGRVKDGPMAFIRSERQCVLRLPKTQAVVFSIHTWCVRA